MDGVSFFANPIRFFQSVHDPTINLVLVMVLIWTTGVLFRKIKQPPVLGELLAGIIFGPALLNVIRPDHTMEVLSELGVFFLMFHAGLETNPYDLKKMGRQAVLVGAGGFLVPFGAGVLVSSLLFDLSLIHSLFVGLGLSITAIAVNVRVLHDLNMYDYRVTPVIIGAAIIDDVLCFAFFSVIVGFAATNSLDWLEMVINMIKVFGFFGLSIGLGKFLFPRISHFFSSREAKGFTFSLIVALLFGLLSELAGLHIIIGAYMAGLFIGDTIRHQPLYQKINDRFVAITYGFLGPIFFVSLSFHMKFQIFQTHLGLLLTLLTVAILGKLIGAGLGGWFGGLNWAESSVVGFAMNGRGAVELIIASVGLELGIIDDVFFSLLVVVAFLTTLIPPVALTFLLGKAPIKRAILEK